MRNCINCNHWGFDNRGGFDGALDYPIVTCDKGHYPSEHGERGPHLYGTQDLREWCARARGCPDYEGTMNLFYWHNKNNFGDMLSPVILEWLTGVKPTLVDRRESGKVLAVGSVTHLVKPGDTVWGSGWMRPEIESVDGAGAQWLAVRGPLTRERVRNAEVPEVYGDPGLLLPLVWPTEPIARFRVGYAPHMIDRELGVLLQPWPQPEGHRWEAPYNDTLISMTAPAQQVVGNITTCKRIYSSSLHAIVCAEAYGIPAAWVPCDGVIGGDLKFRDYLLGTGRDPVCLKPYEFLPPIPDLEGIQRRLIEAAGPLKEMVK